MIKDMYVQQKYVDIDGGFDMCTSWLMQGDVQASTCTVHCVKDVFLKFFKIIRIGKKHGIEV